MDLGLLALLWVPLVLVCPFLIMAAGEEGG